MLRAATLTAALALVAASCSMCKSDAERAADERAKIDKLQRDSWSLLPYRAIKALTRSSASPNRPKAFDDLLAALEDTKSLPEKPASLEEDKRAAAAYGTLAVSIVKVRGELKGHDEDEFPFVWTVMKLDPPPPPPFYDNGLEHLGFATLWILFDAADQGNKTPATEVELYELSRATPAQPWPWAFRTWANGARGAAWCVAGYHYAADEELTTYLELVDHPGAEAFELGVISANPDETKSALRAAGLAFRAYNRLEMGRRAQAVDDIEALLAELDKLGIDNELTTWCHAFVAYHHGRYDEAAAALDKLAQSPYVDAAAKEAIANSATALHAHAGDDLPIFAKGRAGALIARALVARAGGVEAILARVVGPERAAQIAAPAAFIDRTRRRLAETAGGIEAKAREAIRR